MRQSILFAPIVLVSIIFGLASHVESSHSSNRIRPLRPLNPVQPLQPLDASGQAPASNQPRPLGPFGTIQNLMANIPKVDLLKLAINWQPAIAYEAQNPSTPRFSVHGLWPSNRRGSQPTNCATDQVYDIEKLNGLVEALETIWPTSWPTLDSVTFWRFQWERHGSCTTYLPGFGTVRAYFRNALKLFAKLALNAKSERQLRSKRSNTVPIDKREIIETLTKHDGKYYIVEIRCAKNDAGLDYLTEIRFCFSIQMGNKLQHCPRSKDNCGDKVLLVVPAIES